jgi:poly(3-hydroxybutyrate) depolymerase
MIVAGPNMGWKIAGQTRSFYAALPKSTTAPTAVIFQWHGAGDTASNFKSFIDVDPDADPSFPFVLITPESLSLQPIGGAKAGLEWDLFQAGPGVTNLDLAFFDGILACLATQVKVDTGHIYSVGFSAGAIMTDLIASSRPGLIAATYAASGAWFNDKAEADSVSTGPLPKPTLSWPALVPTDHGTAIISHGGPSDAYSVSGITILNFENAAKSAFPFLQAAHRTTLDCPHTMGHQPNPNLTGAKVVSFLKAHTAGADSPWISAGLPTELSSFCTLNAP